MKFEEIQLTNDASGHCINSTQCFSPDDQWIVYDSRNDDSLIGSTGKIAMVNTSTGEIKVLYETASQTQYGPGVGAATFSPVANRVLFIHGIRNASAENPYSMTRRTGVAIDLAKPSVPVFMDARDIIPPFTNGALRGGTHAHTWTADGEWISYTYNDHVLEQASKTDTSVKDLRTIGIMVAGKKVQVPVNGMENNDGEMFSLLVAAVKEHPHPGSDEIEKAFDETWIGSKGYRKQDGSWQHRAIAYQGNIRDEKGELKTEIFVVDIPDNVLELADSASLQGTGKTRPGVPAGLNSRRISFTNKGVSSKPRHWLRSNADGSRIAFLAEDEKGFVQLFTISPNGGDPDQLTRFDFSIQGPVNFSPDGRYISYVADNSVFITEVETTKAYRLTERADEHIRPVGAVIWSNKGDMLCYNRYADDKDKRFLQVFLLKRNREEK
jgi:WD40 repeat protein